MQIDFCNGKSYDILNDYLRNTFLYPRTKARNKENGNIAAIEEINLLSEDYPRKQLKCIEIMRHLDHENILNRFSIHYKNEKYFLVTEYLLCDLHEVIYSNCPLENNDFKLIIYQVLQGLYALHSAGIVHNHICPQAIWINEDCDVKFADFWFATEINKEYNDIITDWTICAPEIICKAPAITGKADIWSCGWLLYELVARRKSVLLKRSLFSTLIGIICKIGKPNEDDMFFVEDKYFKKLSSLQASESQNIIEHDDKLLIDLLNKMLAFNPLKRWDAEKCLQHPYFEEILEYFPIPSKIPDLFDWDILNKKIPREEIPKMVDL
ncbi:unnamed protein product [Blepharisma stoltei]|uniref:Protein kinase domain-containing protein n=1 Tax=Blepharisma stoltei TaxID=1481888 RepID=A0AAU9JJE2_9CILI|nr:unnamed protein product [Blepharisma stoltei]